MTTTFLPQPTTEQVDTTAVFATLREVAQASANTTAHEHPWMSHAYGCRCNHCR